MSDAKREWSEKDAELVRLFRHSQVEGPDGSAAFELTECVLRPLLEGLCRAFPKVRHEALGFAWFCMHTPAFLNAEQPRSWLREAVRRKLLAAMSTPDEAVLSGEPELWAGPPIEQPDLGEEVPSALQIFDEMAELLQGEEWFAAVATDAMRVFEARARFRPTKTGAGRTSLFTPAKIIGELKKAGVPEQLCDELLNFVTARDGYLYGRLKGVDRAELLEQPSVQAYLDRLWCPAFGVKA